MRKNNGGYSRKGKQKQRNMKHILTSQRGIVCRMIFLTKLMYKGSYILPCCRASCSQNECGFKVKMVIVAEKSYETQT
jgi:hypothetical protein